MLVAVVGGLCPCIPSGAAAATPSPEMDAFGLPYTLTIEGVDDRDLRRDIRNHSDTYRLRDRPPITVGQARWRLQRDVEPVTALLQDRGYLDASVSGRVDSTVSPLGLVLQVTPGPPYKVTELAVTWGEEQAPELPPSTEWQQLGLQEPATARTVGEVIDALGRLLYRNGYPFAANRPPTLTALPDTPGAARLAVEIEPGRRYTFGPMTIEGLVERGSRVITRRVTWREGETFDLLALSHLEKTLLQTGLFSIVQVTPVVEAVEDDADGAPLPVHVRVSERKPRTVRLGVSYETDEGFGGKLDWTHRDFFGGGETFSLSARGTELGYSGNVTVAMPSSRWRGLSYVLRGEARNDRYDAYHAQTLQFVPGGEWSRYHGVKLGGSLRWKRGDVEQLGIDRRYFAWSVPLIMQLDFTDSLLDPRGGVRFDAITVPTAEEGGLETRFLKNIVSLRTYWTPADGPHPLTLALRGNLGSILGADHKDVFADERFYAGGGGSVRGYDFQSIGPTVDGVPVGGRSLIEGSAELRAVFTERWGGVLFVDGGMVYETELPDTSHDLLWSAGFGVRIFTPIGPARLDLAFPVTPRDEIDETMIFYISLGQAF